MTTRGIWALVAGIAPYILVVSAAAQEPEQPSSSRPRCVQLTEAMRREQQEAEDFTAKSLDAELQKRGLTRVTLPMDEVGEEVLPVGIVTKGPDGADYLVAGHSDTPSDTPPPMTLVDDKAHALHVVDLHPKIIADKTHLICGCGPPGSGAYMPRTLGYRLPKDRPLKEQIRIDYRAKRVTLAWTNTMDDGSPCPMPP